MILLERVGLASRVHHRPGALSGGEQQRTAVARALAASPAVLLADEPSGNLDRYNAESLHDLFAALAHDQSLGLVVVTHKPELLVLVNRIIVVAQHQVVLDGPRDEVLARLNNPAPTSTGAST